MQLKQGDIVARKSYNRDVYFKVVEVYLNKQGVEVALLRGLDVRLMADSPISDLEPLSITEVRQYRHEFVKKNSNYLRRLFANRNMAKEELAEQKKMTEESFFELPGRVLHIDGDADYLKLCMSSYQQLKIEAYGYSIPESKQAEQLSQLLMEHLPDILVLTGHDGILKDKSDYTSLDTYRNSKYFVDAVKVARRFEKSKDDLIIFAGACQSFFEAILKAGANFASSPKRILIHAFDPVFIVEKLAFASISQTVSVSDVIANTISGKDGVGGIETMGRFRIGLPKSNY